MRILKSIGTLVFAAVLTLGFAVAQSAYAEEEATSTDALQQLEQAAQDGQEAVAAPSEEEAKVESGEKTKSPDADSARAGAASDRREAWIVR